MPAATLSPDDIFDSTTALHIEHWADISNTSNDKNPNNKLACFTSQS